MGVDELNRAESVLAWIGGGDEDAMFSPRLPGAEGLVAAIFGSDGNFTNVNFDAKPQLTLKWRAVGGPALARSGRRGPPDRLTSDGGMIGEARTRRGIRSKRTHTDLQPRLRGLPRRLLQDGYSRRILPAQDAQSKR